jgi:cell division protein FtsB
MKILLSVALVFFLAGCATIDKAVQDYRLVYEQIKLGDSKQKVLSLLEPCQSELDAATKKPFERFSRDGHIYDIYYARSARIPNGCTTDDEFTPYIFRDGVLVEIGWDFLGGPKRTSVDVARENAELEKAKASATKIETNVEQKTAVSTQVTSGEENIHFLGVLGE